MNIDNFTIIWTAVGMLTGAAVIAMQVCRGCCIAKLLRKPCEK